MVSVTSMRTMPLVLRGHGRPARTPHPHRRRFSLEVGVEGLDSTGHLGIGNVGAGAHIVSIVKDVHHDRQCVCRTGAESVADISAMAASNTVARAMRCPGVLVGGVHPRHIGWFVRHGQGQQGGHERAKSEDMADCLRPAQKRRSVTVSHSRTVHSVVHGSKADNPNILETESV